MSYWKKKSQMNPKKMFEKQPFIEYTISHAVFSEKKEIYRKYQVQDV